MVVPQQNFKKNFEGAQVFVKGSSITKPEDKIAEAQLEDIDQTDNNPGLEVMDINVSNQDGTEEIVKSSPLMNKELDINKY